MSRNIPIIFSAPMVRALLDGRKSMTRRLAWRTFDAGPMAIEPSSDVISFERQLPKGGRARHVGPGSFDFVCELPTSWQGVKPGDRLWVREQVRAKTNADGWDGVRYSADQAWIGSTATTSEEGIRFLELYHYGKRRGANVPSIHMPRWASRLTLFVTAVKSERLHDIPLSDVRAEGCEVRQILLFGADEAGRQKIGADIFAALWTSLHGKDSWKENPEVVALTFQVLKANIDALEVRAA